jgi:formate dehydrogenase major subunit
VAGLAASFGSGAMTNDIAGIAAADVILIIGSDTSAAHPVIASQIKQAVRRGTTKLIVLDPKRIAMADYAAIYAAHRPGSDVAVINCLMGEIIRNGWHDAAYIQQRVDGFEELQTEVLQNVYTPEEVARLSGVEADVLRTIAKLFGTAPTAAVFYAMGITQHTTGRDNVWSLANLQMLCGNVGKVGGGVNPLRGQSNVQGACDMGGLPDVYPGYQKVADDAARQRFETAWDCTLGVAPGLTLPEMIDAAAEGSMHALYVMGENPVLSDPDQSHVLQALGNLDLLIVQDIFLSETAQLADVVLPAALFAEKNGHVTNTERRVQRLTKALDPPGAARADWQIIQSIAIAMGAQWHYRHVEEITQELCAVTPQYAGITWQRVGRMGLQWPCPDQTHPGTAILHQERFARGRGRMKAIAFAPPAELPDEDYPLMLTTGRVLQQFHTGTMTRKTQGLNNLAGPMVMISGTDAEKLGIGNSQVVSVSTRRGSITAPAFVTKRIAPGVVYLPFHYAESPANKLTNPVLDPVAKIPEYKVCAARIDVLDEAAE